MYQVSSTWNKMQNVPVSRCQFKENLLFHPERKVAIFTQFTSKKANNLQFSFSALAVVEHRLTSISSCSHLWWHSQCKPESKQDLTALLAPRGWGHGGRLSCSTFSVPPPAIAMLFILHALGEAALWQHLSSPELLHSHWGGPRLAPHG